MQHSFETLAAIRFGYGFRPGEPDIRDAGQLLAQLQGPDHALQAFPTPDYGTRRQVYKNYRVQVNLAKNQGSEAAPDLKTSKRARKDLVAADINARFSRAILSPNGFRERLAAFWADHFTVVPKGQGPMTVYGDFMDVAIRPNISGRFADILIASTLHPSMIVFLNQNKSFGPNSKTGKNKGLGLNENLAREVLELHTMGVGASYSQADVRQFAELLTGLSSSGSGTQFRVRAAEPGAETILGKSYGGRGKAKLSDIVAFLEDVALHPETARHIARKLAVHFVDDAPDLTLVAHMEQAYLRSGGDLTALYVAMLEHPAAWGLLGGKVKQPFGFIVSGMRAFGATRSQVAGLKAGRVRRMYSLPMASMGQPTLSPPGPNGWPEEAEAWITPQGLAARLQWALLASTRFGSETDPRLFVETTLRDVAGETLKFSVAGSENRTEGLALVLASPEFNRR